MLLFREDREVGVEANTLNSASYEISTIPLRFKHGSSCQNSTRLQNISFKLGFTLIKPPLSSMKWAQNIGQTLYSSLSSRTKKRLF